MFFLNLSLPEFLALLGAVSGVAVALYLLDRARRRQTVATLRFFTGAASPPEHAHRRHVQQPLSLLLQLLSMALLLLALAQLRCGVPERLARQNVLILDTSAWMNAASGDVRLMDRARSAARLYLHSLPATDRVMLVRADSLATAVTGFSADRKELERAIDESQPGASVLNIGQALSFAAEAQRIQGGAASAGEVVFVGAGRLDPEAESALPPPSNLRVIPVASSSEAANCGLRKVTVRRSTEHADQWDVFVSVKNYSSQTRRVSLVMFFDGAARGSRSLLVKPGAEENASFTQSTGTAGILDVRISPADQFAEDNRAVLELPPPVILPVTVYSDDPASLRPLLAAIPALRVTFESVSHYSPDGGGARIVLLDRFAPPAPPRADSIWIAPPAAASPVPVASEIDHGKLTRWNPDNPLASGIRSRDLDLAHTLVFRPGPADIRVAESASGPVIVARDGSPKIAVLGFQPAQPALRYQLATPLFFANVLRWMAPPVFRRVELSAGAAGSVTVDLDSDVNAASVQVTGEKGNALPFTLDGRRLKFFSGDPGVARIVAGDRELVYSLTLPSAGDEAWNPVNARRGIPQPADVQPQARDLWQWLALLGGAGLLADWLLFGSGWRKRRGRSPGASKRAPLGRIA